MLQLTLMVLYVSLVIIAYVALRRSAQALGRYSARQSETTQFKLRQLYCFTDSRNLIVAHLTSLLLIPVSLLALGAGFVVLALTVLALIVVPGVGLRMLALRRRQAISESLPDALAQIAGGMRAGSSLTLAIQAFVDEDDGPLGQEFTLLLREQRMGERLEEALDNLAERVQSEEMDLVVSAAIIANDLGGNLAQILQSLSETLRRKLEMENKIKALTAQGRLQARVVALLPVLVLVALSIFEPQATLPIFSTLLGWCFLTLISLMVLVGSFFIHRIVRIDI